MNEAKRQAIQQWLIKSQRDIGSARRLMEGDDPYLDTAVYHCQQAAEKALKAYLIAQDIVFEKTHNLVALIAACVPLEPGFSQLEEPAALLTPYATAFRYPGDVLEPEPAEAEEALAAAVVFITFVHQLLADDIST
jgi:HEPN domain-containing protein